MRTMVATMTTTATTPRGWRPVWTESSRARLEPTSTPRGRAHQRRGRAGLLRGDRESHPHTAPVLISLPRLRKVEPPRAPNLPLRQRRATGLSPWRRGH